MSASRVAILGMTGRAAWKQEDIRVLRPGESAAIAGYSYRLDQVEPRPRRRTTSPTRAHFTVSADGKPVADALSGEAALSRCSRCRPPTQAAIRMHARWPISMR